MTDTELLRAVGAALCGSCWHQALAGMLGVSERNMRRWAAGTAPVPAGVWLELDAVLIGRNQDLRRELAARAKREGD